MLNELDFFLAGIFKPEDAGLAPRSGQHVEIAVLINIHRPRVNRHFDFGEHVLGPIAVKRISVD